MLSVASSSTLNAAKEHAILQKMRQEEREAGNTLLAVLEHKAIPCANAIIAENSKLTGKRSSRKRELAGGGMTGALSVARQAHQ